MGDPMATTTPARTTPPRPDAPRHQALGSLLGRVWPVDQVGVEERAASLAKRSIKRESKLWALDLVIRMIDLTTLEGKDTPGQGPRAGGQGPPPGSDRSVHPERRRAVRLPEHDHRAPAKRCAGSGVKVAAVATYFPSGQAPLEVKLADVRAAVALGADEIDMVIDRGAFLAGDYGRVYDEIVAVKEACGDAHLKVILETGRARDVRQRAPRIGPGHGRRGRLHQDLTGKVQPAATLPVTLVMLEAIRDFYAPDRPRRSG